MTLKAEKKFYTVEEYLALEEYALERHEYDNGKIIKMPGGSNIHAEIALNIGSCLKMRAKQDQPRKFKVYGSDLKVGIEAINAIVYPDVIVVVEKPEFFHEKRQVITNPIVIIEVLSKSTQKYDRTEKFEKYKNIPSLKEYLLVSQNEAAVSAWKKQEENIWEETKTKGKENTTFIHSMDFELKLEEIYDDIYFEKF